MFNFILDLDNVENRFIRTINLEFPDPYNPNKISEIKIKYNVKKNKCSFVHIIHETSTDKTCNSEYEVEIDNIDTIINDDRYLDDLYVNSVKTADGLITFTRVDNVDSPSIGKISYYNKNINEVFIIDLPYNHYKEFMVSMKIMYKHNLDQFNRLV